MKSHFIFAVALALLSSYALKAQGSDNVPITFYGKVLDQESNAVPGAQVIIAVSIVNRDTWGGELKKATLETDQNGDFTVTGFVANSMDISSIKKNGFELSKKAVRSYRYALSDHFHPERDHPVVFRMWKKKGNEPLVGSTWRGKVACDGPTHRFDLVSGHPSTNGNLEITCSRVPVNLPPSNIKPFTYELQIAIIGGGVQATDDEFTYLAPENGYSPNLRFGQKADALKWDRKTPIPKEYYIKTADGHYGRISVNWDLAFAQSPTYLEWECSINPSGSRNLER
jgi:hypothetical protein